MPTFLPLHGSWMFRSRRASWLEALQDYDFEIHHQAGRLHTNATPYPDVPARRRHADTASVSRTVWRWWQPCRSPQQGRHQRRWKWLPPPGIDDGSQVLLGNDSLEPWLPAAWPEPRPRPLPCPGLGGGRSTTSVCFILVTEVMSWNSIKLGQL